VLDGNPCHDVNEISFPLRPMDKVDEYAPAEVKTLTTTNYDPTIPQEVFGIYRPHGGTRHIGGSG